MSDEWRTLSASLPLTSHGGGFLLLELVRPVELGQPEILGWEFQGASAIAKVTLPAKGLPPKTPCGVEWHVEGETSPINGPKAEWDGGRLHAVLDLAAAGGRLGAHLERVATGLVGGLRLRLIPEYPHLNRKHAEVAADLREHPLALSVRHGEELVPLSRAGTAGGLRVGSRLELSLKRSGWACPLRLRVDTPGTQDVVVDLGKKANQPRSLRLGLASGSLSLPDPAGGSLAFDLVLEAQASASPEAWVPVTTARVVTPSLSLTRFRTVVGAGARRWIEGPTPDDWEELGDPRVYAEVRLGPLARDFVPPLGVELWVGQKTAGGLVIQPLSAKPVALAHGEEGFVAVLDLVAGEDHAAAYRGGLPFAVLRPSLQLPFPPVARALVEDAAFVGFGDEDVQYVDARGICSAEIEPLWHVHRLPVLGRVTTTVVGDDLVLSCSVLGPLAAWKASSPKFVVECGSTRLERKGIPTAVPGSQRSELRAALPFAQLGPIAGKKASVRVELGSAKEIVVAEGGGRLEDLVVRPALLGPVTWSLLEQEVHFACRTRFVPLASTRLHAELYSPSDPKGSVPADALGAGKPDSEGRFHFVAPKKETARVQQALAQGLRVRVSAKLPAQTAVLLGIPSLALEPLDEIPVPAP